MKKILIITMILLVAGMQLAAATVATSQVYVTDTGTDCEDYTNCGDCGGVKLEGWDDYIEDDGTWGEITIDEKEGSKFNITWYSGEQAICSIVVKAGEEHYIYEVGGATTGTIDISERGAVNGISHVTFCYACGSTTEVPEFPAIAIPIAAIIGLAFIMQRRKE